MIFVSICVTQDCSGSTKMFCSSSAHILVAAYLGDVDIFARNFLHLVPRYTGGDPDIFLTHFFCTKNDKRPLYLQKKCVRRKFSTLFSTRWYGDCRFLLFFCSSFAQILLVACLGMLIFLDVIFSTLSPGKQVVMGTFL